MSLTFVDPLIVKMDGDEGGDALETGRQIVRSLIALQKYLQFHRGERARFRQHSKESRASLNSYLGATIESAETDEAGRQFRKRLAQEKKDEQDSGSGQN